MIIARQDAPNDTQRNKQRKKNFLRQLSEMINNTRAAPALSIDGCRSAQEFREVSSCPNFIDWKANGRFGPAHRNHFGATSKAPTLLRTTAPAKQARLSSREMATGSEASHPSPPIIGCFSGRARESSSPPVSPTEPRKSGARSLTLIETFARAKKMRDAGYLFEN
jgi:hypothetical protein